MVNKLLLFATFLYTCSSIFSQESVAFKKGNFPDQPKKLKEANNNIKDGDYHFDERVKEYEQALPFYLKAQEFNALNEELNYKIGVCFLHTLHKTKSLSYLENAYKMNNKISDDIHLLLAKSHHLNENWETAIGFYRQYRDNSKDEAIKAQMNKYIHECNNGLNFVENPVNVELENLGDHINTQFPEYLVIINADESVMMFTSQRPGSTGESAEDAHNEYIFHHEDIYTSDYSSTKGWGDAKNIGPPVNTNLNDATIALAPDGHTVLTYNDSEGSGDIYQCDLIGDKWTEPVRLTSLINSPYHESSASFSYDGKSLYFISDNPENNYGDHDIFVSHWDENSKNWGKPENLGATVNTKYSEQGVFAHPDGKSLYFSSKGHNTMGGFDVFKTIYDEDTKTWSKPENLGYPINGPGNDVGIVISASGLHGYVSAYHSDSYGREDIYLITFPETTQEHLTILKGHITDCETKKAITADIDIIDIEHHTSVSHFESNGSNGHYLISLPAGKNYAIEIDQEKYLFHSENFNLPATDSYHEVTKDICLDKINVGQKIVLNNVFFDSNMATLRPTSVDELKKVYQFLTKNQSLKVEFSGHTDSIGSDDYNQKLSEDRAHAVVDYLIEKGINKDRISYAGYGETQPVATNSTEEGRQFNRRTELKILAD